MPKAIAIVLPAYNEGPVIGQVLDGLPATMVVQHQMFQLKPIVVNDGSSDNTAQVVRKRPAHLINHLFNEGAGAATRTGLVYARQQGYQYVLTMDADGQHATKDVLHVAEVLVQGQADFVIGSRLMKARGMPWYRVAGNKFLSLLTFLLFGVFVTDSQSGLKGLNQQALDKITFYSNNYAFCSEMIWKAKQQRLRIKEVPISSIYTEYSLSKGQSNWDAIHIIGQLIKRRFMALING